ncbi:hypothetical protein Tco_1336739 [Tanacetum coccineum]
MAALQYKDDHNKIAYLGRERGCEDFTDILSYLDHSPLRYALTHAPPVVFDSLVKQFWATAVVRPNAAGSHDLVATIDGREVVVTESLIRTQLHFDDANGIFDMPNSDILEGMRVIGYPTDRALTFLKNHLSPQWRFLVEEIPLTQPILPIAAAGKDAADDDCAPCTPFTPVSPVRELTPERQSASERPPSLSPNPPAQTFSLAEPLVFGPEPRPAGYVDPDCLVTLAGLVLLAEVNTARLKVTMSSATSDVTYTSVYTDSEPGRAFWGADDEEVSEGGIPRVIVLGYDGLPLQPVAPPSPDYVLGPENLQILPIPQDEDEREPMFIQAHNPDYIPSEDPRYEDDETEDGPVDYPMDGGDDGDDDDGDSSRDDARDEDEDEEDEEDEEEEEHLAPADSTTVIPADEPVFPPEGTEPVIPPPSTDITIRARITVRSQTSISLPPEAEVERLLAMTTHHLSHYHHPLQESALLVTTALPSPLLPPLPPSLYIPLPVESRDDILEFEQPPRKRLCLSTLGSRYEVGENAEEKRQGIRDVRYDIRDTWVDLAEAVPEIAPMTVGEVNTRVIELAELYEHDTHDLYALLEDAQDSRSRIS